MATVLLLQDSTHQPPLDAALCELGYDVIAKLREPHKLHGEVTRLRPDVIVIATEAPSEEMLVILASMATACPRPVVVFAREGTRELIRKAVDSGVDAYVVDGWSPERLTPIIEAASARFDAYEGMRKELESTRAKLAERKLSEDQAYSALRKMAMDQNLALGEVARRVISVAGLLS